MYISTSTNQSPTRIFDVLETCEAFTAVELTKGGICVAGASSIPIGIAANEDEFPTATVNVAGATLWKVGGQSICAGDLLAAGLEGLAVKASAGDFAFAQALENASANSTAEVLIVRAGKL